jgi:hypothetical protein
MARFSRARAPATGLYLTPDGQVVVEYGLRRVPMPPAQYRANGYKPALEKLAAQPPPQKKFQANRRGSRLVKGGSLGAKSLAHAL